MSGTNIENVVEVVKIFLNSQHMRAHESWISGCVDYFSQGCTDLTEVKNNAQLQWLLNDLKYICPGSLPANLAEMTKTELTGNFVLQMNCVIDISTPKYQQYLKIKKTDTQNIDATTNPEEKNSAKRMLKFELTDGKQDIAGMEYEIIKLKIEDFVPGCKLLIKGPVSCRLGMLLLTDRNIKLLGGEVQSMLETHSLAAQLASKLDLPLIEKDSTEFIPAKSGIVLDNISRSIQNQSRPNNDINKQTTTLHHNITSNRGTNSYNRNNNNFGKRQLDTVVETDKRVKLDEENNRDDQDWERIDEHMREIVELEALQRSNIDEDIDEILEEDLRRIEEFEQLHSGSSQTTVSTEPFIYIKQINELSESEKCGRVFKVKAQIQNVLTKLTMTAQREWNLKCTIIDGTGSMDVEFSSDILSDFLGYTPEAIREIKKQVATNPGIKNDINLAYVKTAETLRTLYCIMELTMITLPKITNIIYYEDNHIDLLKKRLENVTLKS